MLFLFILTTFLALDISSAMNLDRECGMEAVCTIEFDEEGQYTFIRINNIVRRLEMDRFPSSVLNVTNLPQLEELTINYPSGLPSDVCQIIIMRTGCIRIYVGQAVKYIHCCSTPTIMSTDAETTPEDTHKRSPTTPLDVTLDDRTTTDAEASPKYTHKRNRTPLDILTSDPTPHDTSYPDAHTTPSPHNYHTIIIVVIPACIMFIIFIIFMLALWRKRCKRRQASEDIEMSVAVNQLTAGINRYRLSSASDSSSEILFSAPSRNRAMKSD